MIASCVVGYNETYKAYKIYNPSWKRAMVSQDVKFDEDVRSYSSHASPSKIEEREEVVFLEVH